MTTKLTKRLADFEVSDLPAKTRSFWQLVGPGAILVGLSIGSGELIMWPVIVATFGAGMIWAAGVGVFTQLWVNIELGRYTLATGESVYTGFARIWPGFVHLFIFLNIVCWILPGWAMASGGALKVLLTGLTVDSASSLDVAFWTWVTFGMIVILLFGPRLVYNAVEKTEILLVALVTVGLIICAATVTTPIVWRELGRGIINFGHIDPGIAIDQFVGALVFSGAGGTTNIFINYYLRDKGIGMGGRVPVIVNPLRGETEAVPCTGFRFPVSDENLRSWRLWFRHLVTDQIVFFWFLSTVTMLLFIVGSLAVLHPRGLVPEGFDVAVTQGEILAEVIGAPGRILFLVVAFATLFGTQLAIIDGVARTLSDLLYVHFPSAQRRSLSWWYGIIAALWVVFGSLFALLRVPPLISLITSSCLSAVAMAIYVPMTLLINHRFLPKEARPGGWSTLMMVWATLLYASAAAVYLWFIFKTVA